MVPSSNSAAFLSAPSSRAPSSRASVARSPPLRNLSGPHRDGYRRHHDQRRSNREPHAAQSHDPRPPANQGKGECSLMNHRLQDTATRRSDSNGTIVASSLTRSGSYGLARGIVEVAFRKSRHQRVRSKLLGQTKRKPRRGFCLNGLPGVGRGPLVPGSHPAVVSRSQLEIGDTASVPENTAPREIYASATRGP